MPRWCTLRLVVILRGEGDMQSRCTDRNVQSEKEIDNEFAESFQRTAEDRSRRCLEGNTEPFKS
jgi:hypothetical protein